MQGSSGSQFGRFERAQDISLNLGAWLECPSPDQAYHIRTSGEARPVTYHGGAYGCHGFTRTPRFRIKPFHANRCCPKRNSFQGGNQCNVGKRIRLDHRLALIKQTDLEVQSTNTHTIITLAVILGSAGLLPRLDATHEAAANSHPS